jgi:sporulation protein YlmC with PRC-barrel domain
MTKNGAKRIGGIADLKPDSKNANRGTQRGRGLLEKSLRQYGAGRSVLVDREGNLIAGNKTVDVAAEIDLPVRVVQTDGHELVVVQRTDLDLDSSEGRGLAIADNRTGETGLEWNTDALLDLSASGIVDLEDFWKPEELELLIGDISHVEFPEYDESIADSVEMCECPECGHKFPK